MLEKVNPFFSSLQLILSFYLFASLMALYTWVVSIPGLDAEERSCTSSSITTSRPWSTLKRQASRTWKNSEHLTTLHQWLVTNGLTSLYMFSISEIQVDWSKQIACLIPSNLSLSCSSRQVRLLIIGTVAQWWQGNSATTDQPHVFIVRNHFAWKGNEEGKKWRAWACQ